MRDYVKRPADAENYAPQYTSLMPVAHDPEGAGVGWGGAHVRFHASRWCQYPQFVYCSVSEQQQRILKMVKM